MKKFLSCLMATLILCMLFTSAVNAEAYTSIRVSSSNLTFNWDQTSGYFHIYTDSSWLVMNSVSGWLRFEGQGYGGSKSGTGSSTIWITMDKNTSEYSRTGSFIVVNTKNNEYQTVTVTQKGIDKNSILQITKNINTTYDFQKQSVTLKFKSVDSWTISSDKSFVTFSKTSGSGSSNEQSVTINIAQNPDLSSRNAKITLSSPKYNVSVVINITQSKCPEFYDVVVSGAVNMDYNTYWVYHTSNSLHIEFTATVPWRFESSQIQASIKSGGPGKYYIKLTLPKFEINGNQNYGYQGGFLFNEKAIPLAVFYHIAGADTNTLKQDNFSEPKEGKPTPENQWQNNDGIKPDYNNPNNPYYNPNYKPEDDKNKNNTSNGSTSGSSTGTSSSSSNNTTSSKK